ncbi:hypothetical protein CHU92_10470 [Flavobacterium cyanobacteriorum]|uniref:CzcB-like barrel-sandwich hybrid domain-containing protein n=1 Tax=Flavobacterium cyanobacteriorum TaxID=2022802 RepID=A0A255Z2R7_9FLAO|nr:efflux RND transporter periplasmic adaptor subunit [Flavobacterium cyanobacteriorum]OYQ32983.1 hypothetical protein CHU92_13760 [Flavobacterium cyanobacteriorum]OYQ35729.1 hypothetical protein CHU92_10470 [Flavobacterium cyanobacteriorum]
MKTLYLKSAILVIAATLLPASCGKDKEPENKTTETISVKTEPLAMQTLDKEIIVSGQFSTDDEVDLSFKTGGLIKNIYVKEGDYVQKGQVLAELDLTEIGSGTAQSRLAIEKATRDYNRVMALYKDSVATLEQLQNAKTLLNIAQEQNQAANFNYKYSKIYAPKNGYVLRKTANAGQLVNPGDPVIRVNGAGQASWILKAGISDRDWAAVAVGDKATLSSETLAGKNIGGTIVRKSQGIDPYSSTFFVEIGIDNKVSGLASGMFGSARIAASNKTKAFVVPYEALMDANAKTGFVFVTNDGKTAIKVPVVIDRITNEKVIIASGLEGYKYLIVTGNAYLTDKSSIKVIQ